MSIRTTVTLDEDIYTRLKEESRSRRVSFRETVNSTIREGLRAQQPAKSKKPFKLPTKRMGWRPGMSYDCIGELLEKLEGPYHR